MPYSGDLTEVTATGSWFVDGNESELEPVRKTGFFLEIRREDPKSQIMV
jgi:hypothetical protein